MVAIYSMGQAAVYWASMGLFGALLSRRAWVSALAIAVLGMYPPFFALVATIWKDVAMTLGLFTGFVLLFYALNRRSWVFWGMGIFALTIALAARHNSLPAVLVLGVYSAYVAYFIRWGERPRYPWKIIAAGMAGSLVLFFITDMTGKLLLANPSEKRGQMQLIQQWHDFSWHVGFLESGYYARPDQGGTGRARFYKNGL